MSIPTDPFELLQYNMIRAHDTFKSGYDIILSTLANPPKDDLVNFLGYCEAWAVSIEGHHQSEDEIVFPFLNQKMDFSAEAEQHKLIHENLEKLMILLKDVKASPAKFNATQLQEMMVSFKAPLYSHLDEEVAHIASDKLKEAQFAEHDIVAMIARLEKYAKSHGDPFLLVPYMRSHTPKEYKDIWPPMPWLLRKIVIPYILAKRYSGYWKYSPYAMS